jgi:NitT/TauT family transport system ATP-binding protein
VAQKIRIDDLSKAYLPRRGDRVSALEHITLAVEEQEFVTLVGPSGCGKSTLLKIIAGLQPPTSGRVYLDGQSVLAPRRDVGMVFQNPVLLPWRSIMENVLLPLEILRLERGAYEKTCGQLLELVGLKGFERRAPRELSGGMQQRAAICRALIYNPAVLLMDEPFGALDAMTREELAFELLRIWGEHKKTVIFVTHSITEAVLLADRVVVMTPRPGRVAAVVNVALPRPRVVDMEFSDTFKGHVDEIRRHIFARRSEVRA